MAFVLDEDDGFERHAHPESIMWRRLDSAHWDAALKALFADHTRATGSKWSAESLTDLHSPRGPFWLVGPTAMPTRHAPPHSAPRPQVVGADSASVAPQTPAARRKASA